MLVRASRLKLILIFCLAIGSAVPGSGASLHHQASILAAMQMQSGLPCQSHTQLPDGSILLLGGVGDGGKPVATALLQDPISGYQAPLTHSMFYARACHTSTVLPNGDVLVLGGVGADGRVVRYAEVYHPENQSFTTLALAPSPRAYHTATLITDGRVVIAGGLSSSGNVLGTIELWDSRTGSSINATGHLRVAREKHAAALLADGRVLLAKGEDQKGNPLTGAEVFDPITQTVEPDDNVTLPTNYSGAEIAATSPEDNATNVAVDAWLSMRFSNPVHVESVNQSSITLTGPNGIVAAQVTGAEDGMLGFIIPGQSLLPGTVYSVKVAGVEAGNQSNVPSMQFSFTTGGTTPNGTGGDGSGSGSSGSTNKPPQLHPPLIAPEGVTAISGDVLTLNGDPLGNVTLSIGAIKTRTDGQGRFLLRDVPQGHQVLVIDATSANRPGTVYGLYEDGVDIVEKQTNILPYVIWMTALDTKHAVHIPSPTTSEMEISTPAFPGLELYLPKGTVILDRNGQPVREVSITPIPTARPPFPLPLFVDVPTYFTIQPGGATIHAPRGTWAQLYYPNPHHYMPKPSVPFDFWNYDASRRGWYVYGTGHVSDDASQIVPDPTTWLFKLSGAMLQNGPGGTTCGASGSTSAQGGRAKNPKALGTCRPKKMDPIDPSTGLFHYDKTDLYIPGLIPIDLTRSYRSGDANLREFGFGTTFTYGAFLTAQDNYFRANLITADGGNYQGDNVVGGGSYSNAQYQFTFAPTLMFGAAMQYNHVGRDGAGGWDLTFKDGTVYRYADNGPLQYIQDRHGRQLTIIRTSMPPGEVGGWYGQPTQIISPDGRWVQFTYNSSNCTTCISQATDNIGRTVQYQYDSNQNLVQVTDANGGVTKYTYDGNHQMLTIQDARGIVYLTNQYDGNGHVTLQTQADGSTFQAAYTLDPSTGAITQANITDQRGNVEQLTFNSKGYVVTDIRAQNVPAISETYSYTRNPVSNAVTQITDPLNRVTTIAYDGFLNTTSVTTMYGTSAAATTNLSYEPTYSQLTSVTDPLSHAWNFQYDSTGDLTSYYDSAHSLASPNATFNYNPDGTVQWAKDALGNQVNFTYQNGDLATASDAYGNQTVISRDGVGRALKVTNPLGQSSSYLYDALNEVTKITDPLGGITTFTYDPNGNLLSLKDPRQHANGTSTSYTYDNMDRVLSSLDPLGRQSNYQYDLAGNLTSFTDRRGKLSLFTYDALNRRQLAAYGAVASSGQTCGPTGNTISNYTCESYTGYTYDAGDRLLTAVDSAGTISESYNDNTRSYAETTPQGTVTYVYDAAGRRSSLTVTGQAAVNYTLDSSNRLTQIAQGSANTSFGYDTDNRRYTMTLPNNVATTYCYDNDSRLTGLFYSTGGTTTTCPNGTYNLGDLTYAYDATSRRTQVGGSFARTNLPQPVVTTAYDFGNQLTNWNGATPSYDLNGNMLSDGVNSISWNARNQVANLNSVSPQYDGYGRRTKNLGGTSFLYDGPNDIQELSGSTVTANNITGGTDEFFTRTDSASYYPLTDVLGSVVALTNSSGSVVTSYTYDAYGNTTISGTANSNVQEYTGRENEGNGLYYYRARYYNPNLGRFVSQDPAGFAGGINQYVYAGDNPANFIDPFGLDSWPTGGYGFPYAPVSRPQDTPPPTNQDYINSISNAMVTMAGRYCQCLHSFYSSTGGEVIGFFSLLQVIPGWGPDWKGSAVEDFGGTTAKLLIHGYLERGGQTMAGTPIGSMSGAVADTIVTVAKRIVFPAAAGATAVDVIAHEACVVYAIP